MKEGVRFKSRKRVETQACHLRMKIKMAAVTLGTNHQFNVREKAHYISYQSCM